MATNTTRRNKHASRPKAAPLTDAAVAKLPLAPSGQRYEVRDTKTKGLAVRVGATARTFFVAFERVVDGRRRNVKTTLGRHPDLSVADARRMAANVLADRVVPEAAATALTLRAAFAEYVARHLEPNGRSPATIASYRYSIEGLLAAWLDRSLDDIARSPAKVEARYHELIESNGLANARNAMVYFRAVFNRARRMHPGEVTQPNPVVFGIRSSERNPEQGRAPIAMSEFPAWGEALEKVASPVQRELIRLALLTGARSSTLYEARWDDIDLAGLSWTFPRPKQTNGRVRPYRVPISRQILRSLVRLRMAGHDLGADGKWVFPSPASASGHLVTMRQRLGEAKGLAVGHALRATYIGVSDLAGVREHHARLLVNHQTAIDVHNTYKSDADGLWPALADAQQRISDTIDRLIAAR